jgi:hypothetical protein
MRCDAMRLDRIAGRMIDILLRKNGVFDSVRRFVSRSELDLATRASTSVYAGACRCDGAQCGK